MQHLARQHAAFAGGLFELVALLQREQQHALDVVSSLLEVGVVLAVRPAAHPA